MIDKNISFFMIDKNISILLGKDVSVTLINGYNFTGVFINISYDESLLTFIQEGKSVETYKAKDILDIRMLPEAEQAPSDNNYQSKDIMVSHPSHYISETGLEVIDVIEAFTFDLKGIEATDTANVIKYICRWKEKNGLQDLEKAMWYLKHLINHVEKLEKENE